jgi:copper chaperone
MMKKTLLRSQELSCPSCVAKIEKALKSVPGVQTARVHFNTGRIEVEHDPVQAREDRLVDAVRSAGYESRIAPF